MKDLFAHPVSWKWISMLLVAVFLIHFSNVIFKGEILFPHDNAIEAGAEPTETGRRINRKFSDLSSVFIPELANNFDSNHRAWINTWNPHTQLGRPAFQISGLSKAYPLTNLLSCFTRDPFRLYTWLVVATVGLTAIGFVLFLRSLGLQPAASGCAALGLAFTTVTSYWLSFVMFLSALCWSVFLLWLITEFIRKSTWLSALGISFSCYCLLITAYPQVVVLFGYLITGYTLLRIYQTARPRLEKLWIILRLGGCAAIGLLAAAPVLLDLLQIARSATRLEGVSDDFFIAALPHCRSWKEAAEFLVSVADWSWLGNAVDANYPSTFNGLSFTPVFAALIALSFFTKNRPTLGFWQIFLTVTLVATIIPSVYLFAVHHLGFGLSRIQLLFGGIIPGFVIAAYVLQFYLQGERRLNLWTTIGLCMPLVLELSVTFFQSHEILIYAVLTTLLLTLGLIMALGRRSELGLLSVAAISTLFYGRSLVLTRPISDIRTSSKLTHLVTVHTQNGARYAKADQLLGHFPSNQEAIFSLMSVHSYDSLSSLRYQELVKHLNKLGSQTYGRYFKFINPAQALADEYFPFLNVSLLLSTQPLQLPWVKLIEKVDDTYFYKPEIKGIDLLQTADFSTTFNISKTQAPGLQVTRDLLLDDYQKISVTPSTAQTLLFLSQQYHADWSAMSEGERLQTVPVNSFFQGVILPPHTSNVELCFRPWVYWSWIPQVFFAVAALLLLLRSRLRHDSYSL